MGDFLFSNSNVPKADYCLDLGPGTWDLRLETFLLDDTAGKIVKVFDTRELRKVLQAKLN